MMRFFIWYQVKVKNFNGLGPALGHVIYIVTKMVVDKEVDALMCHCKKISRDNNGAIVC